MDGHAAGASAVVYGLLAVCMVWAPRNELNCTVIFLIGFRVLVFHWDLYYTTVALLYIGEQLFGLLFWGAVGGRVMVSEMGHLSGAFWGTVVAVVLVKAKLVDCEGWDLFALWAKRKDLAEKWKQRGEQLDRDKMVLRSSVKAMAKKKVVYVDEENSGKLPDVNERASAAVRRVRALIEDGDTSAAAASYKKSARIFYNWPSQPELYELIKAFHARGAEADSIPLMRDHCLRFPGGAPKMGVKLAQILIRNCERPTAALRVLEAIPLGSLPTDLEKARLRLVSQARQMQEEGVLELEGDD
jgi:hypothetical protein